MQPVEPTETPARLADRLSQIAGADHESEALTRAVNLTMATAGARRCVIMTENGLALERGFAGSGPPMAPLVDVVRGRPERALLGDWGEHEVCVAQAGDAPPSWLVACRPDRPFTPDERDRVATIGQVLSLTLVVLRSGREEDELRSHREHEAKQRRAAERELAHQALHDGLTGLPNRDLILDRAKRLVARAVDYGDRQMAALMIDLDDFQQVNDSLDQVQGDRLLVEVAERLAAVAREFDSAERSLAVGRYAGDEFLLLGERLVSEQDVIGIAERVREVLARPSECGDRELTLTASIGISCTGPDRGAPGSMTADQFVADAEVALGRAKQLGGDRFEIFDDEMRARLSDRALLEADLRAGLRRGDLRLHYQPVVSVADGELVAVEALARWQHPLRGLLGPGEFIALAERGELIVELGAWVIDEACAQISRWHELHPARLGVPVSVNVSARQLTPELVATVSEALRRHRVDPAQLALEITETLLVRRTEEDRELLRALARTGVSIVLDDFGTGYSSLSYLRELPLHQLKLDRSFCAGLDDDLRAAKIVAATIEMGRALGMTVVAEGVETPEQLTVLRRLGADFAQGFWFARPEPPDDVFARLLQAYDSDRLLAGAVEVATSEGIGVLERRTGDRRHTPHGRRAEDRGARERRAEELHAQDLRAQDGDAVREPLPVLALLTDEVRAAERRSLGRLAGLIYLAGSVLAIPADVVMRAPSPLLVVALTLMGLLTGAVCLALPWDRLSDRWLHLVPVLATLQITTSAVVDGRHAAVIIPFYALVAVAVAYGFRDRRVIAAHGTLIVVALILGALLLAGQPGDAVAHGIVAALVDVSLIVVIVYLRERLEGSAAEMRALAQRDPLTDVGNYRVLHEHLHSELNRHRHRQRPLSVLLIDLDRFKQVNERLGHAAGDDVLRRVARTLSDTVGERDTVARQGGDEFAVLAPDTDADGAAMLAGRLRQRLRRLQFAGEAVDATIGWAVYPSDGDSPQALLAHADSRLLGAKRSPERGALALR